jgi:molybdate transport system substrate-binding protein
MKRVVVAVTAAATMALAGCSSSSSKPTEKDTVSTPPATTAPASAAPATTNASAPDTSSAAPTGSAAAVTGAITVLAASSLTGAFKVIGAAFEKANPGVKVNFSFGSSGDLSASIQGGSPGDVFASAAPKNMQAVIKAGDATSSTNFVSNQMEIATPAGNPKKITTLADLAKPSNKVALCVATAPCGALAATILAKAGVKVTPVTFQKDVKSTLAEVTSGEVDAAMVYVTDVKSAGTKATGVVIPAAQNGSTEYPIAVLKGSKNAATAAAFVTYVESTQGLAVLTAAGFLNP